jgi:hypothetical protein
MSDEARSDVQASAVRSAKIAADTALRSAMSAQKVAVQSAQVRETARDVAEAQLALHGVDWEERCNVKIEQVLQDQEAFAASWSHWIEHGVLPDEEVAIATEQMLDAVGVISAAVHGLVIQMGTAQREDQVRAAAGEDLVQSFLIEVGRLATAVTAFDQWGLTVPTAMQSLSPDDIDELTLTQPLTAADPKAVETSTPVQRLIGALVVAPSTRAEVMAWLCGARSINSNGVPVFDRSEALDGDDDDLLVQKHETLPPIRGTVKVVTPHMND